MQKLQRRSSHAWTCLCVLIHVCRQLAVEQGWLGSATGRRELLCLLLILERAKETASQWEPYISFLPESYGVCQCAICVPKVFCVPVSA